MSQKMAISCILDLTSKDPAYFPVLNALRHGARILLADGTNFLISDEDERCLYIIAQDLETYLAYEFLVDYDQYDWIKSYDEMIADYIAKANHKYRDELWRMKVAVYDKDEPLAVDSSFIRPLDITYYGVIGAHYEYYDDEELTAALENGFVFGYFKGEELCGFIGLHSDASIGMLRVFEKYRRQGIAYALESYLINLSLSLKMIPFAEIKADNTASLKLQEKLEMLMGRSDVFWVIQSAS